MMTTGGVCDDSAPDSGDTAGYSAANPLWRPPNHELEVNLAVIEAHITGTVWKIEVSPGDSVDEGDTVVILESMKMEMPVEAEDAGTVKEIPVEEGQAVSEGDTLVVLE
jgi:acetyl-CoA carboxylase biotin carboxyl carrier protein